MYIAMNAAKACMLKSFLCRGTAALQPDANHLSEKIDSALPVSQKNINPIRVDEMVKSGEWRHSIVRFDVTENEFFEIWDVSKNQTKEIFESINYELGDHEPPSEVARPRVRLIERTFRDFFNSWNEALSEGGGTGPYVVII